MAKSKFLTILGTVASVAAILMYVSYISTIQGNLNGQKGDWPIVIANAPGIVFGLAAAITALM